jgi:hypothetical protein
MRIFAGPQDPPICENLAEDVCADLIAFMQRKRAEALAAAA